MAKELEDESEKEGKRHFYLHPWFNRHFSSPLEKENETGEEVPVAGKSSKTMEV